MIQEQSHYLNWLMAFFLLIVLVNVPTRTCKYQGRSGFLPGFASGTQKIQLSYLRTMDWGETWCSHILKEQGNAQLPTVRGKTGREERSDRSSITDQPNPHPHPHRRYLDCVTTSAVMARCVIFCQQDARLLEKWASIGETRCYFKLCCTRAQIEVLVLLSIVEHV